MNAFFSSKSIFFLAIAAICFSYVTTIVFILQYGLPVTESNFALKALMFFILILSVVSIIFKKSEINSIQFGVVIFFIIYSARLSYNLALGNEIIFGQSVTQMIGYYFALTIIPVFFIVIYMKPIDTIFIHRWSFLALIAGNLALLANMLLGGDVYADTAFAGREEITGAIEGTAVLNPIVVGLTGTLLMVFCLGRVAAGLVRGLPSLGFHGVLMLAGLANLLAGGSRGPLVGLLLSILLLVVVSMFRRNTDDARYGRNVVWLFLAGIAVVFVFLLLTDTVPVYLFDRIAESVSGRMEGEVEERDFSNAAAWDIFTESPLLGKYYTINGGIAHNVVMEMLMATGVIGAIFFSALVYNAVIGVWRLAIGCVGPYGLSIALVTVTYATLGLTSYSIVQSPELWIFIVISSTLGRFSLGADGKYHERTQLRS